MPRLTLQIVIASTRPGRVGLPVGEWFRDRAGAHGGFELDVVDLAELGLPFMDEPNHPRLRRYEHQHTKAYKPAGLVSYGGVAAGTRAAQANRRWTRRQRRCWTR